jgi:CO dehydrogenase/acetyl-CoA synthase gamma subunit (corrinoid Fe-S protein)
MATEAWLKSDDPEKFAAAAVKCEHVGGFCIEDGFCHFDGKCFRSGRSAMARATSLIEAASEDEPPDVAENMRLAAILLRQNWKAMNEDV